MKAGRKTVNMAVAFAAAWFLALQSLLGAYAMAAGPQRLQLDAFGNVICTHEGIGELPDGSQPAHMPDCCVLGCNLAAPLPANPPAPIVIATGFNSKTLHFRAVRADQLSFARQRSPANPRAPPQTA